MSFCKIPFCKKGYKSILAIILLFLIKCISLKLPFSVGPPVIYNALKKDATDEI